MAAVIGEETSQEERTDSDCRGDVLPKFLAQFRPERIRETEQFRCGEMDSEYGFNSTEQLVKAAVVGLPPDYWMSEDGILHL